MAEFPARSPSGAGNVTLRVTRKCGVHVHERETIVTPAPPGVASPRQRAPSVVLDRANICRRLPSPGASEFITYRSRRVHVSRRRISVDRRERAPDWQPLPAGALPSPERAVPGGANAAGRARLVKSVVVVRTSPIRRTATLRHFGRCTRLVRGAYGSNKWQHSIMSPSRRCNLQRRHYVKCYARQK